MRVWKGGVAGLALCATGMHAYALTHAHAHMRTHTHAHAHQGAANSHKGKGWEQLTDAAISAVSRQRRGVVFLLWGKPAQVCEVRVRCGRLQRQHARWQQAPRARVPLSPWYSRVRLLMSHDPNCILPRATPLLTPPTPQTPLPSPPPPPPPSHPTPNYHADEGEAHRWQQAPCAEVPPPLTPGLCQRARLCRCGTGDPLVRCELGMLGALGMGDYGLSIVFWKCWMRHERGKEYKVGLRVAWREAPCSWPRLTTHRLIRRPPHRLPPLQQGQRALGQAWHAGRGLVHGRRVRAWSYVSRYKQAGPTAAAAIVGI